MNPCIRFHSAGEYERPDGPIVGMEALSVVMAAGNHSGVPKNSILHVLDLPSRATTGWSGMENYIEIDVALLSVSLLARLKLKVRQKVIGQHKRISHVAKKQGQSMALLVQSKTCRCSPGLHAKIGSDDVAIKTGYTNSIFLAT